MKKLVFILVLTQLLHYDLAGQTWNGDRKINVAYKKQTLRFILTDLQNKFGLSFSYTNDQLPLLEQISIKAKDETLALFLHRLFTPLEVEFIPLGSKIILKHAPPKPKPKTDPEKKPEKPLYQTIRGLVIDKDSRLPIEGATITVTSQSLQKLNITDSTGMFRMTQIPIGRWDIEVSVTGYQKLAVTALLINSAKEAVQTFELSASDYQLDNVTVAFHRDKQKASNEMATVSARSFTVEETSRYAASIHDPARMALSFAGVTSTNDLGNELIIRGNSPKGVLWQLEGIEIVNPNHLVDEGSSGGGVSMISSSMLANSDFYTGAFPAEYGNALSGVFDLKFRKGNAEKREFTLMAGALGTEFSTEGPFRKGSKSSYLFNYRYSTLALLEKAGLNPVNEGTVPIYQDLSFHHYFPTKKAGNFSLFGIAGSSKQSKSARMDAKLWDTYWDRIKTDFRYKSISSGLKHEINLNRSTYLQTILAFSGSFIKENMDSVNNNLTFDPVSRDIYNNSTIRLSAKLNKRISNRSLWRTGVLGSYHIFRYQSLTARRSQNRLISHLQDNGQTNMLQLFTQWKQQFSKDVSITYGLHSNHFDLNKQWTIEPRMGLEWRLRNRQSINFGAGLHSRMEPLVLYFGRNRLPDGTMSLNNPHLKLTKALHFVGGYNLRLSDYIKFKSEIYYQYLYDVPVIDDPNLVISSLNSTSGFLIYDYHFNRLENKGSGKNYGIELSIERSLNRGYYFLVNTSLYQSKFTAANGKTFNTRFNGNYISNAVGGKEFKVGYQQRNILGINTKLIWTGGQRYTPVNVEESIATGETIYFHDRSFTLKARDYMRMDISISFRWNKPKATHAFFLDLQNLFDYKNINGFVFDTDKSKFHTVYNAGIIPVINYRLEF